MTDKLRDWLYRLFEEYKIVRRLGIFIIYGLIVFATIEIFTNLTVVTAAVSAAYATLCGLLAIIFKFYNESRNNDKSK
jgi:hypothetical protein